MARGRQKGTPGRTYPNRKDLRPASKQQPIKAATGQPYGIRKQQIEAQRAQPLPAAPTPDFASLLAAAEAFDPGERQPFDRPTERPDEPLTAGLSSGAGPGPEVLGPRMQIALGMKPPSAMTASRAAFLLEQAVSSLGDEVSASTLAILNGLKKEAQGEPPATDDLDFLDALEETRRGP
jgi:hypothetical protein